MKTALGALDWAADHITPKQPINCDCPVCVASDVLRRAIDEAERQEQKPMHPEMRKMWEDYFDKCFRERFPFTIEQEPVAWKNAAMRIGEELSSVGPDGYYDMTAEQWLSWAMDQRPTGKQSLQVEPVGFMNAGHLHELQQGRLPYGYVYPRKETGANVAVYTAPPQRQPLAYAGVIIWVGDKTVTQLVTGVEIRHEALPGMSIEFAAKKCLSLLAAHGIGAAKGEA